MITSLSGKTAIESMVQGEVEYLETDHSDNAFGLLTEDYYDITCKDEVEFDSDIARIKNQMYKQRHEDSGVVELVKSSRSKKIINVKYKTLEQWR